MRVEGIHDWIALEAKFDKGECGTESRAVFVMATFS